MFTLHSTHHIISQQRMSKSPDVRKGTSSPNCPTAATTRPIPTPPHIPPHSNSKQITPKYFHCLADYCKMWQDLTNSPLSLRNQYSISPSLVLLTPCLVSCVFTSHSL